MDEKKAAGTSVASASSKKAFARRWLRALHRDAGYLAAGLTFLYAVSGIAVNHIADWDPSFQAYEATHSMSGLPRETQAAALEVLRRLEINDTPSDVYESAPNRIDVTLEGRTLHIDTERGQVTEEGQKPRFFLRIANWLHLNRGKKAWTYAADGLAGFLIFLSISGLFMIPGKKGLIGRGALLFAVGVAIPIAYVTWSGGP